MSPVGPDNPFRMLDDPDAECHPMVQEVDRRCRDPRRQAMIRELTRQLMDVLDHLAPLWLALEEQLTDQARQREEASFNLGYEHGHRAGIHHGMRLLVGKDHQTIAVQALAQRLHQLVIETQLTSPMAISALLEAAWLVVRQDIYRTTKGEPHVE